MWSCLICRQHTQLIWYVCWCKINHQISKWSHILTISELQKIFIIISVHDSPTLKVWLTLLYHLYSKQFQIPCQIQFTHLCYSLVTISWELSKSPRTVLTNTTLFLTIHLQSIPILQMRKLSIRRFKSHHHDWITKWQNQILIQVHLTNF